MAHGKDAARDIIHGRQAGRWAGDGAGKLMAAVHRARLTELGKGPAKGTWPRESLELWRRIAATAGHPARARAREVLDTAKAAGW